MWTRFWDMYSGGDCKQKPFEMIYIEAPEEEAKCIFYAKFGHNPDRVTCTCCGRDYSTDEDVDLEHVTAFQRNVPYLAGGDTLDLAATYNHNYRKPVIPLDEYIKQPDVFVLRAVDILPEWRTCEVPPQGYVWRD